jgi:N-formylglutamate amidohydrolase
MTRLPDPEGAPEGEEGLFVIENVLAQDMPVFLNSPHSGEVFPQAFVERSQLALHQLRRASDLFVDELFAPAVRAGLPMMRALLPRSYVDLNREPLELDPRLIQGALPVDANTRSLRVAGGLGTVPRVIGDQIEIYAGKLSLDEVLARIQHAYVPYHLRLYQELAQRVARHGAVLLLDMHSMPSSGVPRGGRPLPDVVIGDRYGGSAETGLVSRLEGLLKAAGLKVERNQPYAGGYITEHYGRPRHGWHAIQIEINRALYMDEVRLEPHSGFSFLSGLLSDAVIALSEGKLFDFDTSALHFSQKAAE